MSAHLKIVIIDYGFGNLFSLANALKSVGIEPIITDNSSVIKSADGLILPGVGAFGDGMKGLSRKGLIRPILEYAQSGKNILGICLGMQFLFDYSEEFGRHKGLGLIKGAVKRIPEPKNNENYKIPNIGWSGLERPEHFKNWKNTVLSSSEEGAEMYFVHSYVAFPKNKKDILASINYASHMLTAAVKKNNITGVQFHPEKSGMEGLNLLKQWAIQIFT